MYAFEKSVEIGADVLEMDAHITKDSQIVLMHDENVDRTTNGTGLIEELTLAELKQLDAAYQWSNDDDKILPLSWPGYPDSHVGGTLSKISTDALCHRNQANEESN